MSVLFFAKVNGTNELWYAVRFSPSGTWRAADDVLSLSGAASGVAAGWRIAAGECPLFGPEAGGQDLHETELVYVMYRPDRTMLVGRVVSTPRPWMPGGAAGSYSPLGSLSTLLDRASTDAARNVRLDTISIATRPFPDDARPWPWRGLRAEGELLRGRRLNAGAERRTRIERDPQGLAGRAAAGLPPKVAVRGAGPRGKRGA